MRHRVLLVCLGLACFLAASGLASASSISAFSGPAGACPLIIVDENGHGSLDFSGCGGPSAFPLSGVLAPDPGPGGLASVLTYDLTGPPALVAGDVLLTDGDRVLDVVRFNPAGTGGNPDYRASLLFYSDNIGGSDSLGDTPGPPSALYTNVVRIAELGDEFNNGAIYTPLPNQPGFVPGFNVSYNLISDQVPEPASLILLGTGLALGARRFRARRR